VDPFTTDPFFGERIESFAALLGLEEEGDEGVFGGGLPEPHPAARRANAISADPTMPALLLFTVFLELRGLIPGKSP
jgi:hypothetical protein